MNERSIYEALKSRFPPPPYLIECEVKPWLLEQARQHLAEEPLSQKDKRFLHDCVWAADKAFSWSKPQ